MTRRTLLGSVLILAAVIAVVGALSVAIDRQHRAALRAQRSLAVIAAANLTQQRLLAVQTNIRGYLIRGNEDLLTDYRVARAALPDATYDLQALVAGDPQQMRRAQQIRDDAQSYVNDYGDMVIGRTREDGVAAGRDFAAAAEGTARANSLQERITELTETERSRSAQRASEADEWSDRASWIAIVGLAVCVFILVLATWFVARRVVQPVGRLSAAAERVRRGDFSVEVPTRGSREVARLGSSFNAMARSLEESRDELESQNAELEAQAITLEERQEELVAQHLEISTTAAQLADQKQRAELFSSFADRLAATRSPEALATLALEQLGEVAGADVGVAWAEDWRDPSRWARLAVHGLEPSSLPEFAAARGEGASARAVTSRDVVFVEDSTLRVHGLAGSMTVRWEVHVPLTIGERAVGVVALGGVSRPFSGASGVLARLAGQAAVALAEASALAERDWLSQVNAAVLDGVREGIALIGLDHELVFANAAMSQLAERLSLPLDVAVGTHGADLAHAAVDPEDFEEWEKILADSDEPTADELLVAGVSLERFTAPVDAEDGSRIGRLVMLRDVTRERDAERLKTDLMATVSHELRTPLASVLGYAELLRTRRLEPSARDEIVGTVHREAKRLSGLIDDFLDLQSIEQDRFVLTLEPFSVDTLLQEAVATFRGQSQRHELELSLCATPVRASGDRGRIVQVVSNLLSNAIKYSPEGGVVRVAAECASGVVRVSVTDAGLGIPAEDQGRIFEKFFRVARPDARVGGTGLGLALAHEIVVAHGGDMGFTSVEGEGSTFWFTLPASS